jgi:DNA processing protein
VIAACDSCLRRAQLVAVLAPRIAALLNRAHRETRQLLALSNDDLVAAVRGPDAGGAEALLAGFDTAEARRAAERVSVGAVCRHEEEYPGRLHDLVDQPAVVFFRGDSARLRQLAAEPAVALIGSRRPSPYGIEVAQALGRGLSVAGVTVVSGLALGIDGAAHSGCLDAGGFPVAVLAGGPDVPYPPSHRRTYARVAESGLVLSEMPPGQRAFRWSFPARNRLMAALAGMTVVVEAAERSGSIITVEFAQDLGRVVGAVPGRITARSAKGTNAMLRDGACVVRSVEDVLDDLLGPGQGDAAREAAARRRLEALPAELRRVLDAVESGESPGSIAESAGLGARDARVALARLESEGLVVRGPLGSYERSAGD